MKEYSTEASLDQYYKLQDTMSEKKRELQKVTQEKRSLEKDLLKTEKTITSRRKENDNQYSVNFLNEQLKTLKDKIRDMERRE